MKDDQILRFFLCIPASAADAAAVNPKGIKTLLANGLITFFISGNPVFSNGPSSLPRNPLDCIILDIWVFDKLISVDDLSAKALRIFETCLLVDNNLWGKLVSSSPIIFNHNLKTTSVLFFIADFNLSSCEFDSFTFYTDKNQIIQRSCTQENCTYKNFSVPCEKSKTVSCASSIIKNIVVFPALSKFAIKLIAEFPLDLHQELDVYANLLQSFCNNL